VTNIKRVLKVEPSLHDLDWTQMWKTTAREGGMGASGAVPGGPVLSMGRGSGLGQEV